MTPKLKADLAIIQATIKTLRQDLTTALDVETDLKIKIYIEETGLNVGDKVAFRGGTGEIKAIQSRNGRIVPVVTLYNANGRPGLRTKDYFYESDKLMKI